MRPDFEKAQNAATELLLDQTLNSLFIDVRNFRFRYSIQIDSVQHFAQIVNRPVSDFTCHNFNGCCVIKHPRCNIILYDEEEENAFRKHWGIVHEIGHIYLEHDTDGEIQEIEAHFFAAQTTMPEIILHEILARRKSICAFDISGVFNASLDAADKRLQTFYRRRCFNFSKCDQQLLRKFQPIIDARYPIDRKSLLWACV